MDKGLSGPLSSQIRQPTETALAQSLVRLNLGRAADSSPPFRVRNLPLAAVSRQRANGKFRAACQCLHLAKARRELPDDLAVERGGAHDPSGPVAGEIFRWDLGRECSQDGVGTL